MNSLEEIRTKLREKGITIDSNKLNKGLLNTKNYALDDNKEQFPSSSLPSNPLYKKFPLWSDTY